MGTFHLRLIALSLTCRAVKHAAYTLMFSRGLGNESKDLKRQVVIASRTGKALNDEGRTLQADSAWQMGLKASQRLGDTDPEALPRQEFLQMVSSHAEACVNQHEQDSALTVMEVASSLIVPRGSRSQVSPDGQAGKNNKYCDCNANDSPVAGDRKPT